MSTDFGGRKSPVNDLDFCVAAVVCKDGPISAYGVREEFRRSMTSTWSSSAGTIYPVIQRLVRAGYISTGTAVDGRGTQLLTITDEGRRAVAEWLIAVPLSLAAPTADPVRSRLQFLGILQPEEAAQFVADAIKLSEQYLSHITQTLEPKAEKNWLDFLATIGSALQVQARVDWLRLIQPALKLETPSSRQRFIRAARKHVDLPD